MQQTNVYHVMKINFIISYYLLALARIQNFWIKIINAAIATAAVHNVILDMIANLVKI